MCDLMLDAYENGTSQLQSQCYVSSPMIQTNSASKNELFFWFLENGNDTSSKCNVGPKQGGRLALRPLNHLLSKR